MDSFPHKVHEGRQLIQLLRLWSWQYCGSRHLAVIFMKMARAYALDLKHTLLENETPN